MTNPLSTLRSALALILFAFLAVGCNSSIKADVYILQGETARIRQISNIPASIAAYEKFYEESKSRQLGDELIKLLDEHNARVLAEGKKPTADKIEEQRKELPKSSELTDLNPDLIPLIYSEPLNCVI